MKEFYTSYQQNMTSCDSYMESITNMRNIIVNFGGTLGYHPLLVKNNLKDALLDPSIAANNQHIYTTKTEAKEAYVEAAFLSGLNHHSYG